MPKVNLSFKNNDKDIKMYASLPEKGEKSEYIKDAIRFYQRYKHLEYEIEGLYLKHNEKSLSTNG